MDTGESLDLTLGARSPFSLPQVVNSHGWVQLAPFQKEESGGFTYVDRLPDGQVVRLQVQPAPGGLHLRVLGSQLDKAARALLVAHLRWMTGLDQDFSPFYGLVQHEPKLAHVPQQSLGRLLRSPTLFEDAVKTILTTNTTWSGTIRMNAALVEQYGEPLPGQAAQRAFPTPERLAQANIDALRRETRLGYRAPYVQSLAQAVATGELDLEAFKTSDLPTLDLRKRLLALKGIGPYAAANLLMLLGRYDFLPIDSWALKVVSQEWHDGQPVGPAEVEAAFEKWGEWKGLAYWFWNYAE